MKQIRKRSEPPELRAHRRAGGHFGDPQGDTKWKERLQEALLREQGRLCCYCMARISRERMKVEHYLSQERHPERALDHCNLFAACAGGEGWPRALQTCDTRKGSAALSINPTGNIEPFLRYLADGTISSADPAYQQDLDTTLNLNAAALKRARKAVIQGLVIAFEREMPKHWKPSRLREELARWEARDERGDYREFCRVVVYFLEKRLRRA
ncbi:MAG: TIGR02646 family protein [Nannocystis sp.]|nr:retron system putative HNH endonuclease [Nannocystis sp.]MBA3549302.1 TIGR02646 family protein [Nannocystis sp.]